MHQNIRGEEAEEPSHYASVHFWSPPDHNLSQALRTVNKQPGKTREKLGGFRPSWAFSAYGTSGIQICEDGLLWKDLSGSVTLKAGCDFGNTQVVCINMHLRVFLSRDRIQKPDHNKDKNSK